MTSPSIGPRTGAILLLLAILAVLTPVPAAGTDAGEGVLSKQNNATPPGVMVGETVQWMEAVGQREPAPIAGDEPMIRSWLRATDEYVYFIRERLVAEDAGADSEGQPADPMQRRMLMRLPLPDLNADPAEAQPVVAEPILPLGAYPFGYHLLPADQGSPQQIVIAQQTLDTNGDQLVDQTDDLIIRLARETPEGWRSEVIHQAIGGAWLAGVRPMARDLLLGVPTGEPFERDFQIIPLDRAEDGADGEPRVLATGIGIGAIDPLERYVIVTSLGDEPELEQGLRREPQEPQGEPADPDERLRYPFTHRIIPYDADERIVVLSQREEPMMVREIVRDVAYVEQIHSTPAEVEEGYPTLQSRHTLEYYDLSNSRTPVRIPISRPGMFDDEYLAVHRFHGVLHLRNSAFGRQLRLYTGGDRRNEPIRDFSPLTVEFAVTPGTDRLIWLAYSDDADRPFRPTEQPTTVRWLDIRDVGRTPE